MMSSTRLSGSAVFLMDGIILGRPSSGSTSSPGCGRCPQSPERVFQLLPNSPILGGEVADARVGDFEAA